MEVERGFMDKVNPLFQDSTLSSGTSIRTQFELSQLVLRESETVFLNLLDSDKRNIVEMKCIDEKTGTYVCAVWLKHKQDIKYQFFVRSEDEVIHASPIKSGIAMYTVLEAWSVSESQDVLEELNSEIQNLGPSVFENSQSAPESKDEIIENLIEKWGL